jgi:hypothetical protein
MNVIDENEMIIQIQSQYELRFLIESVMLNARHNDATATAVLRQLCKLKRSERSSEADAKLQALMQLLD